MIQTVTIQAATAATATSATFGRVSTDWTSPSMTLTFVGAGIANLAVRFIDEDGAKQTAFRGDVTWSANGTQIIPLPTFRGRMYLETVIKSSTAGTVAATVSRTIVDGDVDTAPFATDSTSIQFDRAVVAPGILSGNTALRKSMKERLNGTGLRYACWGSSTLSNDSTQGVLAGAVTSYAEATSGIFWNLNACGADWTCIWNGAVAGSGTSTIYTKIVTDWNTVAPLIDFAVFQPFANNLSNPADDMVSAKDYAGRAIQYMIRSGKPVVLVMPFCPNSASVSHAKYQDAQAWLYAYAATYSLYPGQIQIWDLYQALSNGVDVPQAWMAGDQTPRIHLNGVGAYYAAQATTATNVVNNFGGFGYNTDPYGTQTPVGQLAAGTDTVSGCVVTAAANAPDGRLQWNIIPSASLSYVRSAAITVSTSKVYRMWMDYDLVAKTNGIEQYVDGAKCPNGAASMRDGIFVNSAGGSINYSARQLGRVRKFSHPFTPASTSVTIDIFPGGPGWQLLFRSLALFEYTP